MSDLGGLEASLSSAGGVRDALTGSSAGMAGVTFDLHFPFP